jgi:two-component system cell cycle sensor histidine kinase/response regulator CckA
MALPIELNDAFADLTECPREQLIGMDVIDRFVSPEDIHQVRQNINSNVEGVYEIKVRSATGRLFPAELRTRPGELAGRACRVVSVRDITNRKKTERQLIQSQKMEAVGTLAGGIAHDFNNMLAGIQGNVEIIRHQLSPKSTHQKRLAIINQIVQRGAKLSGQLLGYARGGQTEINEINLNRLVEDALEMFGHTQRHIDIQTRFSPDIPVVRGDRTQIEQVLLNLMINAVHAMPTGGKLFIETHATVLSSNDTRDYEIIPGPYAMLSVRDTGHGMDQKTQRQIFEPFFTTKAQGQGTGLGLASTYGIVKNHKGYIEVYSDLGEGSQFNVLLPAAGSTEKAAPAMDTSRKKGTETLLVVDDEPDFLDVGREMLLLLGYDVITAGNSDEAVAVFKKQAGSIKLVIVDMIMPGADVEGTVRRFREIDPSIRVLLSSGYSQTGNVAQQLMQCCDGFIQKPFRLTSLSTKVRKLLGAAQDENP